MKNETQRQLAMTGIGQPKRQLTPARAYCKKDLKLLYNISYRTLAIWLRPMASEIGPMNGIFFTNAQLKIIFDAFGYPGE